MRLLYKSRGRENRTPISGFGDRCTTIVRYPYKKSDEYGIRTRECRRERAVC